MALQKESKSLLFALVQTVPVLWDVRMIGLPPIISIPAASLQDRGFFKTLEAKTGREPMLPAHFGVKMPVFAGLAT